MSVKSLTDSFMKDQVSDLTDCFIADDIDTGHNRRIVQKTSGIRHA